MDSETLAAPGALPESGLENDIAALALQREELQSRDAFDKGKYPEGQPPDATRALRDYQIELATHLQILQDFKLAHSIAQAIETDGPVIANLISIEVQAAQDRRAALQISTYDFELESPAAPPAYEVTDPMNCLIPNHEKQAVSLQWDFDNISGDEYDDQDSVDGTEGGHTASESLPSSSYRRRQQKALRAFASPGIECCACTDNFRLCEVFTLKCNDVFCRPCLTKVVKLSMQDKRRFPPKCCDQALSQEIISSLLTEQDLEEFQITEIEVSCAVKTYCSNASCGRFIPPDQIVSDRAYCTRCGSSTCTNCINEYHSDDCPEDPLLQATLALAADQKWQRCFSCRTVVILAKACNHITCRCGAEFCYICGLKWKTCACDAWNEENIIDRAEEVVDREAVQPLQPQERQRRVEAMRQELLQTHECAHSRRFQRIFDGTRRGFRCELCENRHWKYILECRRCHLRVCEDCRRHRV